MKFRTIITTFFALVMSVYADVPMPGVEMSNKTKQALAHIAKDYGTGNIADIMRARKENKANVSLQTVQSAVQEMGVPLLLGTYSNTSARYNKETFHKQIFTDNPTGTMVEFYRDI